MRIIKYSPVYSTFFLQISTRNSHYPLTPLFHPLLVSFNRSSRSLIRLPHFQIFHLPSRALRGGSREKYLAASRDGLCGISADGTEFFLFRRIIRKKSPLTSPRGIYSGSSRGTARGNALATCMKAPREEG